MAEVRIEPVLSLSILNRNQHNIVQAFHGNSHSHKEPGFDDYMWPGMTCFHTWVLYVITQASRFL